MPLVTSKEMLQVAVEGHYAVGAFNANNMEQIQGIVNAAVAEEAPVILQVSQGAIRYAGLEFAAAMVKTAAEMADVPVVLHLDHGTDFSQNVRCLRAGFTSLMFDGSALPFEENVAITARVAEIAHIVGIPVEAELGKVLKSTDNVSEQDVLDAMTKPEQAREFVERTKCDSLAVAVGSVHAMRSQAAELNLDRIRAIREQVDIPFVLHGSSGVREESALEAIPYGIAKINVATLLNQAFTTGIKRGLAELPDNVDPRKILVHSRDEVMEAVRHKIQIFGASGQATSSGYRSPRRVFPKAELGEAE
ncbi:MAG: class II fructose-bisphosphate aldolase [Anaerolineae bacterium]